MRARRMEGLEFGADCRHDEGNYSKELKRRRYFEAERRKGIASRETMRTLLAVQTLRARRSCVRYPERYAPCTCCGRRRKTSHHCACAALYISICFTFATP